MITSGQYLSYAAKGYRKQSELDMHRKGVFQRSEGIANNAKTGKWISVEERLPETNRDCLLLLDTEEIVIGYCRRDLHAFVEGGIVLVKDVTHWMPLPDPPKGGAE